MASRIAIKPCNEPAGGRGALKATVGTLSKQGVAVAGSTALLRMNQPDGFDCPGCAWPDPKHASSFEFCENGAQAVAWEATARRCTPEFFAAHTVSELESRSDCELEMQARLTHPMLHDAGTDHYVPVGHTRGFDAPAADLRTAPWDIIARQSGLSCEQLAAAVATYVERRPRSSSMAWASPSTSTAPRPCSSSPTSP